MLRHERCRGYALILSVCFMAVLCALGIGFARMMSVERGAARCEIHRVKAMFVCEGAIEYAIARLEGRHRRWLVPDPRMDWYYMPSDDGIFPDLRTTENPSFEVGNTGYSGRMLLDPGREEIGEYKLRVRDTSSMIWVNDSNPDLGILIGNLSEILGLDRGVADRIIEYRNQFGNYSSRIDLLNALSGREYAILAEHLTCFGVADPHAVRLKGDGTYTQSPRAPVCVNTAGIHILASVMMGIVAKTPRYRSDAISMDQAVFLAKSIVSHRINKGPFRRYSSLESFIKECEFSSCGLSSLQIESLVASSIPHLMPAFLNYDKDHSRIFDTGSLSQVGTTLSIHSSGTYEIQSISIVRRTADEDVLSQCSLIATVSIKTQCAYSSQRDYASLLKESRNTLDTPEPSSSPIIEPAGIIDALEISIGFQYRGSYRLMRKWMKTVKKSKRKDHPDRSEEVVMGISDFMIDEEKIDLGKDWSASHYKDLQNLDDPGEMSILEREKEHSKQYIQDEILWFKSKQIYAAEDSYNYSGFYFGSWNNPADRSNIEASMIRRKRIPWNTLTSKLSFTIHQPRAYTHLMRTNMTINIRLLSGEKRMWVYGLLVGHYYYLGKDIPGWNPIHPDRYMQQLYNESGTVEIPYKTGVNTFTIDLASITSSEFKGSFSAGNEDSLFMEPPESMPEPSSVCGRISLMIGESEPEMCATKISLYPMGDLRPIDAEHYTERMKEESPGPGETGVNSIFCDGDRYPDGAYFSRDRRRVRSYRCHDGIGDYEPCNLPVSDGYTEFWFKPDEHNAEEGEVVLFNGTNQETETCGVQTALTYDPDVETFRLVRFHFDGIAPSQGGSPIPPMRGKIGGVPVAEMPFPGFDRKIDVAFYTPRSGDVEQEPPKYHMPYTYHEIQKKLKLRPHEWHHIEFWWKDFTDCRMRIDGDDRLDREYYSVDGRFLSVVKPLNDFGVGPRWTDLEPGRSRGLFPDGTFAGLKIVADPTEEFLANQTHDRYEANNDPLNPTAYYDMDIPIPKEGEPVGISWTERETDHSWLELQVMMGDTVDRLKPDDGSGTLWKDEWKDLKKLPVRVAFLRDEVKELRVTPLFEDLTIHMVVPRKILEWRYDFTPEIIRGEQSTVPMAQENR